MVVPTMTEESRPLLWLVEARTGTYFGGMYKVK